MKKRNIVLFLVAVLFLASAGFAIRWAVRIEKGIYVEGSKRMPYAYTRYKDHVVLEKYVGTETDVTVPERVAGVPVTEIGYECFNGCRDITRVMLHEHIETIHTRAFYRCYGLREVLGGNGVRYLWESCFEGCLALETVELGEGLEVIGAGAFRSCTSLKWLSKQEKLTRIGEYAFAGSALEEFSFNQDAKLDSRIFEDTPWPQKQGMDFIVYGDGILASYTGDDETVYVPDNITKLQYKCFYGTTAAEIYIPQSVTAIETYAFSNCENVDIYIPKSVINMPKDQKWGIIENAATSNITIIMNTSGNR